MSQSQIQVEHDRILIEQSRRTSPASSLSHRKSATFHRAGNLAIQSLFRSGAIRAKLGVSHPADAEEREADQLAQGILRSPEIPVQRYAPSGGNRESSCSASSIVKSVLHSSGDPLDASTRAFFEPRFAQDFGYVRIHTGQEAGASARSIQALAYTVGSDIVFAQGQYQPHSASGQSLIAHELAHVLQHRAEIGHPSPFVKTSPRSRIYRDTDPAATPDPPPPTEVQDSAKEETRWRARVDQAVRSVFHLSGPGLTSANVKFFDQSDFGKQFTGSDLEEKLFTIFLDFPNSTPGVILDYNHQPMAIAGVTTSTLEQLRQFIKDGIAKGYFEGQSRELDVQAQLDDPKHELHRFPVFRITPQDLVSQFIAGVTDISGPRSSRSIKMRVAGGTFQIDTLCHETCHFYVSNTFRNMVTSRKDGGDFLGYARISQLLLEGFAEYFNRQVMVAKADTFGPPAFDYPAEVEQVHRIVATLGEASVRAAYFGGDPAQVKRVSVAVDEYKGAPEDWLVPGFVIDVDIANQSKASAPAKP